MNIDVVTDFFQSSGESKVCSQRSARAFQLATDKAFDHLHLYAQTLEETKAIRKFYRDFGRTTEIVLRVAGEERVHYTQKEDGDKAEEKGQQFLKELESISLSLKTAMATKLHQDGPFFSGRCAMQNFLFPARGLLGERGGQHKFVVEVMDKNRVIIEEIVEYPALRLLPLEEGYVFFFSGAGLEFRDLTKREEKILEKQRQSYLAALRQSGESSETEQLPLDESIVVDLNGALIATVRYELKYYPQQRSYQLTKLSEDNISIPSTPIEKLLFATEADSHIQEKLRIFFEKLIEVIKTAILAIASQFSQSEEPNCSIIRPGF